MPSYPSSAAPERPLVFQSSPAPKGGCHPGGYHQPYGHKRFQSSPAPKGGCHPPVAHMGGWHGSGFNPHPPRRAGAIRNENPPRPPRKTRFNPHPPRRAGAMTNIGRRGRPPVSSFNPHPPRRAGAIVGDHARRRAGPAGFNPHPPRRAGAIPNRCLQVGHLQFVSILTRPEGRVPSAPQPACTRSVHRVSILTRPEGRVPFLPIRF